MRLVPLIVAAIAAQSACGHRDPPDEHVWLRYRLVDGTDPERARRALDMLFDHQASVGTRGDLVEITFDNLDAAMAGGERISDALRGTQAVEVRVVEYDSPYVNSLVKYVTGSTRASELKVRPAVDELGRSLRVTDTTLYVNESWAKAHACKADRVVGSGYACWVPARVRLDAVLKGDPDLFVDPPPAELATPPRRAWIPAKETGESRFYLTFDPPILLDGTAIASLDQYGVVLTARGAALLDERASGSAVQLAVVIDGGLLPAKRDGTRLRFTLDDKDASRIRHGLPFAGVHLQLAR